MAFIQSLTPKTDKITYIIWSTDWWRREIEWYFVGLYEPWFQRGSRWNKHKYVSLYSIVAEQSIKIPTFQKVNCDITSLFKGHGPRLCY